MWRCGTSHNGCEGGGGNFPQPHRHPPQHPPRRTLLRREHDEVDVVEDDDEVNNSGLGGSMSPQTVLLLS